MINIEPYHTKDFLKYLTANGWTDLQRSVRVSESIIDLVATSPDGKVCGFRFLNKWWNMTKTQVQQSWEKGLRDIYYYMINKNKTEYSKEIIIWIGIFISTNRIVFPVVRSNRDSDIGVWQYHTDEIHVIHEAKGAKISIDIASASFLDISLGTEFKDKIIEDDGKLTKAVVIESLQVSDEKLPQQIIQYTPEEQMILGDLITGGLIAGGLFAIVDFCSDFFLIPKWILGLSIVTFGILFIISFRKYKKNKSQKQL